MTRELRPYRWFGRDAPHDQGAASVSLGPDPGPEPEEDDANAWWRWLGARDRAHPGDRSFLWMRADLEAVRAQAGLAWEAFLERWEQDLRVLGATPPGQRPVPRAALEEPALREVGQLVVATLPLPWAPLARPEGYFGGSDLLGSPAEVVQALGLALERGSRLEGVLPGLLDRLPEAADWRTDFWLLLLEHVDPRTLVHALDLDEERLAAAVVGTLVEGPMLATAGEALLGRGVRSGAAVTCCLRARGISDPETVQLWVDARDPATGLLVAARAGRVVDPLREALLGGAADEVGALLLRIHQVGGPEGVADVLDVLLAEGASTPTELRALFREMGEPRTGVAAAVAGTVYAGWMGVEDAGGRW